MTERCLFAKVLAALSRDLRAGNFRCFSINGMSTHCLCYGVFVKPPASSRHGVQPELVAYIEHMLNVTFKSNMHAVRAISMTLIPLLFIISRINGRGTSCAKPDWCGLSGDVLV